VFKGDKKKIIEYLLDSVLYSKRFNINYALKVATFLKKRRAFVYISSEFKTFQTHETSLKISVIQIVV
jgi:hypothetical protein